MNSALIAMLIGVIATMVLHSAKAMMRHGITMLQHAQARRTAFTIYIVGIVLVHTNPIWIIFSNLFAPPSYFTSMYGIGLIAVLGYAMVILHEPITKRQILGALLIVVGTLSIGIDGIARITDLSYVVNRRIGLWLMGGMVGTVFVLLLFILYRARRSVSVEILFGVLAGLLSGFDPILKGMAQVTATGSRILPMDTVGWIVFISSFFVSLFSFLVTQWGFFYRCRVVIMIAAFSATYVSAPLIIQVFALPGFVFSVLIVAGLVLINAGVLLIYQKGAFSHSTHIRSRGLLAKATSMIETSTNK